MQIAITVVTTILTLIVIVYICFCADNLLNFRGHRIGYTGSNMHICGPIVNAIVQRHVEDTSHVTLIEAGAGLAKMARYLGRRHDWRNIIALEIRPHLILLAKLWNLPHRVAIDFVREDLMKYRFPHDAVVYSYLSTSMLRTLHTNGSLQGCLFISLTFTIPGIKATEEIRIPTWQHRISVYDFR
jgi:hypothetical protein